MEIPRDTGIQIPRFPEVLLRIPPRDLMLSMQVAHVSSFFVQLPQVGRDAIQHGTLGKAEREVEASYGLEDYSFHSMRSQMADVLRLKSPHDLLTYGFLAQQIELRLLPPLINVRFRSLSPEQKKTFHEYSQAEIYQNVPDDIHAHPGFDDVLPLLRRLGIENSLQTVALEMLTLEEETGWATRIREVANNLARMGYAAPDIATTTNAGIDKQNIQSFRLTDRELTFLRLLTQGLNNGDISTSLGIAEQTTRNTFTDIFKKLGVRNRTEALAVIRRERLI